MKGKSVHLLKFSGKRSYRESEMIVYAPAVFNLDGSIRVPPESR